MPPQIPSIKDIIFVMKFIMGYEVICDDIEKITLKNGRFTIDFPKRKLTNVQLQEFRKELMPVFADQFVRTRHCARNSSLVKRQLTQNMD